jgi:hypothetical protein
MPPIILPVAYVFEIAIIAEVVFIQLRCTFPVHIEMVPPTNEFHDVLRGHETLVHFGSAVPDRA